MDSSDYSLQSRGKQFLETISTCQVTDSKNSIIDTELAIQQIINKLNYVKSENKKVYIVGNGGSAGIASHAMTDFVNMVGVATHTLHDISLITCMSNDYGYENVYAKPLETFLVENELVIAISSSGQSKNIINAVQVAKAKNCFVFTMSGFKEDNPLRELGDLNLWLRSNDYGFVEYGHAFILHNIADRFH